MRNFSIYLALLACLFVNSLFAQQTFYDKIKAISNQIEKITADEKAALKNEVEAINNELESGTITIEQANEKKQAMAVIRANNIETKVAQYESEIKELIQKKVDGKIKDTDYINDTIWIYGRAYVRAQGVRTDKKKSFSISFSSNSETRRIRDSIRQRRSEPRTTSQFIFAAGINNLVTDGAVANSDYRYWGSHFYEWGVSWNYRLAKESNLLHFKYGVSLMYNNLRPTDNRMFVDQGKQTTLEVSESHLHDSRFRNVNIVVPLHLEFDFTPVKTIDDKKVFRTHKALRFGIGGYAGMNVKSKQIIHTKENGYRSKSVTKGSYNVNDFIYGISTYLGYKETSLYIKYDINPLFKDNEIDQNNISLGIRFDLN